MNSMMILADGEWPPQYCVLMGTIVMVFIIIMVYIGMCANYGEIMLPDLTKLFKVTIVRPVVQYCPKCGAKIDPTKTDTK